jgi:hypothetical protein
MVRATVPQPSFHPGSCSAITTRGTDSYIIGPSDLYVSTLPAGECRAPRLPSSRPYQAVRGAFAHPAYDDRYLCRNLLLFKHLPTTAACLGNVPNAWAGGFGMHRQAAVRRRAMCTNAKKSKQGEARV